MPFSKIPCWVAQLFRNPCYIDLLLRGVVTLVLVQMPEKAWGCQAPPVIMLLWPTPTSIILQLSAQHFFLSLWPILLSWPLTYIFAFPCLESLPELASITQNSAARREMDVGEQRWPNDSNGIVCSLPPRQPLSAYFKVMGYSLKDHGPSVRDWLLL